MKPPTGLGGGGGARSSRSWPSATALWWKRSGVLLRAAYHGDTQALGLFPGTPSPRHRWTPSLLPALCACAAVRLRGTRTYARGGLKMARRSKWPINIYRPTTPHCAGKQSRTTDNIAKVRAGHTCFWPTLVCSCFYTTILVLCLILRIPIGLVVRIAMDVFLPSPQCALSAQAAARKNF